MILLRFIERVNCKRERTFEGDIDVRFPILDPLLRQGLLYRKIRLTKSIFLNRLGLDS